MDALEQAVTYVSLFGTALGISSRIPQILRVVSRRSGSDLSKRALLMNVSANMCFAMYATVHNQWPILINNLAVICLDGTLIFLRGRYGQIKKISSGSDLNLMVDNDSEGNI